MLPTSRLSCRASRPLTSVDPSSGMVRQVGVKAERSPCDDHEGRTVPQPPTMADVPTSFETMYEAQSVMQTTHAALRGTVAAANTCAEQVALWNTTLAENDQALDSYARAQHHLAKDCWQHKEVDYVVDSVHAFFFGTGENTVCGAGAHLLKQMVLDHKNNHNAAMPADQYAESIRTINEKQRPPGGTVQLLDIGSCYNPFAQVKRAASWLRSVAVDLKPSPAAPDVHQCDWLNVEVRATAPPLLHGAAPTPVGIKELRPAMYDAVVMSYLLSFIPTAPLRWLAVANAVKCLRPNGVLVVVEARRGAHRLNSWPAKWTEALRALGLVRLRLDTMKKSVGFVFRRGDTVGSADDFTNWLAFDNEE